MIEGAPDVSIVIAAASGWAPLAKCLAALARQQGAVTAEIIVAAAAGSEIPRLVGEQYPRVRTVVLDRDPSVPRLRAAAIHAARGGIVAITEDHCIPSPDWYQSIQRAHEGREAAAIGGAVDNAATSRLVDWAVYFCEYSRFASPMRPGETDDLPGPNVSYKHPVLRELREFVADEYWETFVHDELRGRGHQLWCDPSIRVDHCVHFRFGPFMVERYHYGRAYAGRRNPALGWAGRFRYAVLSPLLIPVFVLRVGRNVLSRRRHWSRFARTLPMVCCFAAAAAAGEGVGYVLGGGRSALRLR